MNGRRYDLKVFLAQHAYLPHCPPRTHQVRRVLERKRQVIEGVNSVQVRMALHLIHTEGYANSNDVTSVIVVRRLIESVL